MARRRRTLEDLRAHARERGGDCLAEAYGGMREKVEWLCEAGHTWPASGDNVLNKGSWCPDCAGLAPHTIEEMRGRAAEMGGACLSSTYQGRNEPLMWECADGHRWESSPASVFTQRTWCPDCAGNRPATLEQMQQLAAERGGVCLSTAYVNDGTHLKWRCAQGHTFRMTPGNVKQNRWCGPCSKAFGERLTRSIFEQLFGAKFPTKRPKWLVNSRGNRMELDGYHPGLSLAFEHQGEDHYSLRGKYIDDLAKLRRRIEDDEHKLGLCRQQGVVLIQVPEIGSRVPVASSVQFIIGLLDQAGVDTSDLQPDAVNIHVVRATSVDEERLQAVRDAAAQHDGELESPRWLGSCEPLWFRCQAGHRFQARPANVLAGKWCRPCSGSEKLTLADMREAAAAHGGWCVSEKYVDNQTKLDWVCAKGHAFRAVPASVRKGHWCARCAGVASYTVDDMHLLALERGGVYLSSYYRGANTKAAWRCEAGHVFERTPSEVRNGGRWCRECAGKRRTGSSA